MKRMFVIPLRYALITFLFFGLISGCQKFVDIDSLWHQHNPDCRIERMVTYRDFDPDTVISHFSYNQKGNPVSVIFSYSGTGHPNYNFRYDNKGRLTDYIGAYGAFGNGGYEFWYQYQYDQKGRIISDTSHGFGFYDNYIPTPSPYFRYRGTYEYDQWDRVIKVTRLPVLGFSYKITETCEYNQQGNLSVYRIYYNDILNREEIYDNYDNKVNIHRTNKVWMFVDRDYSKNNRIRAEKYNNKDLPVRYRGQPFFGFLYQGYIPSADIEYRCK